MDRLNGINITDAAEQLGCTVTVLREGLEQGVWPFGVGLRLRDSKKRVFYINEKLFQKYIDGDLPHIYAHTYTGK
ncbi:MAG: hypothetical protein Q4Q17_01250 [Tissierellia bacterium]|nr:hypothetical protein [Tissierellia bacterium]